MCRRRCASGSHLWLLVVHSVGQEFCFASRSLFSVRFFSLIYSSFLSVQHRLACCRCLHLTTRGCKLTHPASPRRPIACRRRVPRPRRPPAAHELALFLPGFVQVRRGDWVQYVCSTPLYAVAYFASRSLIHWNRVLFSRFDNRSLSSLRPSRVTLCAPAGECSCASCVLGEVRVCGGRRRVARCKGFSTYSRPGFPPVQPLAP